MNQDRSSVERRSNLPLRELLDELLEHVRAIARNRPNLAPHEIVYAQQRLEWLADEIWRLVGEQEEAE